MTKVICFNATTIGDAWFQAVNKAMTEGRRYLITKGSYEGIHRAGISVVINILYPGNRPLAPIMPEGSNLPPPTNEEDINQYLNYLMTDIRQPNEHYTYGEDSHWLMDWVIKHYKDGGFGNNHCYLTIGRPETVYFYDRDIDYEEVIKISERSTGKLIRQRRISNEWNNDPAIETSSQCLRGIDTWIQDNRLHFWCYFRSWDLWGGFPVNLGGLQLFKEYMADQIGVDDGILVASSKDLHVYEHSWLVAGLRIGRIIE